MTNGPGDDEDVEEPDRLPGEHVLDVVERAAAHGAGLDLLGRQGEVDRRRLRLGARAGEPFAQALQLGAGVREPRLQHGAVRVGEGRALELAQDPGDLPLRRLDLRLEAVGLHLEILDPVALADDRAERGQLRHRALHLGDRDAERDLRRADALGRRVVLERGDAAAVRERDLLCALRRAGERLDVVHAQAQLRLVALELARWPAGRSRRVGRRARRRRPSSARCLFASDARTPEACPRRRGRSLARRRRRRSGRRRRRSARRRRASGRSPSPRRARGPA